MLFIDAMEAPLKALAAPLVEAGAANGVIAEALERNVELSGLQSRLTHRSGERVSGDEDGLSFEVPEQWGGIRKEEQIGVEGDHGIEAPGVEEMKGKAGAEGEAVLAMGAIEARA